MRVARARRFGGVSSTSDCSASRLHLLRTRRWERTQSSQRSPNASAKIGPPASEDRAPKSTANHCATWRGAWRQCATRIATSLQEPAVTRRRVQALSGRMAALGIAAGPSGSRTSATRSTCSLEVRGLVAARFDVGAAGKASPCPTSRFYRTGSPADRFTRPLGSLVGKVVQEKQRLRRALEAERDDDPTAGRQLIGSHTGAPTFRHNEAKVPPEGAETPSPGGTEFAFALDGGRSAYSNTGTRCTWRSAPDRQESGCAGGRREPRMSSRLRDHASQTREEPGEREEA